ncbi:MAG: metallophosphoesterase [Chitinophagaceae bacterium]
MRNSGFLWIIVGIMVLLDIYVFQAIKFIAPSSPKLRTTIYIFYWLLAIGSLVILILLPYINFEQWPKAARSYIFATIAGVFFAKIITSLFLAIDDVRRGGMWIYAKLFTNPSIEITQAAEGISRSNFLSWLGLAVGGGLFGTLMYGFNNKYKYNLNRIKLSYKNLPQSFKGMKIVHISDIHSGSFMDKQAVQRGVDKIIEEQPDLILFTGDLVNDRSSEMNEYMDLFSKLQAPLGVFSTLGNHDYGDYVKWESEEAKSANLHRLKAIHGELGWRLLMNEHVVLERGEETIAVLGIENWSAKGRFPKYGKMNEAHPGTEKHPFKILLSHDPSHWEAEVLTKYKDIDLMLAGHTHGMQFGLDLPGFKWSPIQYIYKQWAGLYESDSQKLYVNRGFGFLGYPGRVGILAEITVIELT